MHYEVITTSVFLRMNYIENETEIRELVTLLVLKCFHVIGSCLGRHLQVCEFTLPTLPHPCLFSLVKSTKRVFL